MLLYFGHPAQISFDGGRTVKNSRHAVQSLLTAISLAVCALTGNSLYAQRDAKGCKDSPYISRFPGTIIGDCESKDDDTADFVMGEGKPVKNHRRKKVSRPLPDGALSH